MRLFEFEAKALLREFGIPVPDHRVVAHPCAAGRAARELGADVVVKAQVPAGGRMHAGGVCFARGPEEAEAAAGRLLGGSVRGWPVERVLVEPRVDVTAAYYAAVTYDPRARRPVLLVSRHGGIDVEARAEQGDGVLRLPIDPLRPLWEYRCREAAAGLDLHGRDLLTATRLLHGLYQLFAEYDATLAETNPLVRTADGRWLAVDARVDIDDDAAHRQGDLVRRFGLEERMGGGRLSTPLERKAAAIDGMDHRGVAGRVVEFDGEVALLIGGGGASLTVFDAVRAVGGRPANYCEVGGNPTVGKVAALTALLLHKPGVRRIAVIMNIVSNTRADLMARGVIKGVLEAGRDPAETVAVFRVPGAWEAESVKVLTAYGIRRCRRGVSIDEAARMAASL